MNINALLRTATFGLLLTAAGHSQEPVGPPQPDKVVITPQGVQAPAATAAVAARQQPVVELAICLDTSGSMDGLIETAKQRLWAIVNDLALAEPTPRLRVALLTYGNNGHEEAGGWVRNHTGFTEDLDMVSKELFGLRTDGGTELVGRVMSVALEQLDWTAAPSALKLMVVAGNESADQDRQVDFRAMCAAAILRDIMVSSIYCGGDADAEAPGWKEVALLSDGHFAVLDHGAAPLAIATPWDDRLGALSTALNATYLPFGKEGRMFCENQWAQDANARGLNSANAATRAQTKGGKLYFNGHWDLVDATTDPAFQLSEVEKEDLPEAMREMTEEQMLAHIERKRAARVELQAEIAEFGAKRDAFVLEARRKAGLEAGDAFDRAVRDAMRARAEAKGLRFPQPELPAAPEAAEVAGDDGRTQLTEEGKRRVANGEKLPSKGSLIGHTMEEQELR